MSYYPPGSESTDPRDNDAVTPVTPADHADIVREALTDASVTADEHGYQVLASDCARAVAALDALQAQAEEIQREYILESTHHAITGVLAQKLQAAEAEAKKWFGIYEEELTRAEAAEARVTELETLIEDYLIKNLPGSYDRLRDTVKPEVQDQD